METPNTAIGALLAVCLDVCCCCGGGGCGCFVLEGDGDGDGDLRRGDVEDLPASKVVGASSGIEGLAGSSISKMPQSPIHSITCFGTLRFLQSSTA